jgi:hypothetical protein
MFGFFSKTSKVSKVSLAKQGKARWRRMFGCFPIDESMTFGSFDQLSLLSKWK